MFSAEEEEKLNISVDRSDLSSSSEEDERELSQIEGEEQADLQNYENDSFECEEPQFFASISESFDPPEEESKGDSISPILDVNYAEPAQILGKSVLKIAYQKMQLEPTSAKKGDKPVTFHKKIKSSGYSKAPEAIKFSKKQVHPVEKSLPSMEDRQYLIPFGRTKLPNTLLIAGGTVKFPPIFRHPLTKVRFNYSGTKVAVVCADNSVSLLKAGSNQFAEFTNLTGHNGKINTVDFSLNEQLFLTSSDDGTARLWNLALGKKQKGNKLLVIRQEKQNLIKQPEFLVKKKKVQPPEEIRGALFYYQDKFIAYIHNNKLKMAKYQLSDSKEKDDVKRLQSKAFSKKVFEYCQQDTQYFTTLTAHNLFQSHLALLGCSNRDLLVLDINYNKRIAHLKSPHLKPLNSCNFFVGPSQKKYAANIDTDSCNLFISQAADGWAKMWDLRTMKIIREFKDHTNRVHSIHGDVSPCLRYFASGSQDRAMYLYDVRQGQLIEKTKNADHGDSVMDVKFSPLLNEIATVSLDGQFRVFGRVKKLERSGAIKKGAGGGGKGMKEGRIKLNELRDAETQREVREQIRELEYE